MTFPVRERVSLGPGVRGEGGVDGAPAMMHGADGVGEGGRGGVLEQVAANAGVQGTPTVILNGELFNGGPEALLEELEK